MVQLEVNQVVITTGSHMNGNIVSIYPLIYSIVSYYVSSHYSHEYFQMLFALFKLKFEK
jgi:hypothetical protein